MGIKLGSGGDGCAIIGQAWFILNQISFTNCITTAAVSNQAV
jgi:hypothetical protein